MNFMKLSALALAITSATVTSSYAEYQVLVKLEPDHINIDDYEVAGNISLTRPTINRGESSSIQWTYTYANEINIHGVGDYTEKSSSITVNPLVSTNYIINIKNGAKTKVEHLNLTVIQPVQDITFDSDTYRIGYGKSAKLSWNVLNSSGVSISPLGPQSDSGIFSVSPVNDTTYTLTANGYDGVASKTKSLDITVVPDAVIQSFTADKTSVTKGDSVNFSWNISNPESISFNGETLNTSTTTKNVVMNTLGSSNYKLDAESLSGTTVSDTLAVNVIDVPVVGTVSKPATNVFANAAYSTSWTGTGVSSYKLSSNSATSGVPVAGVTLGAATSYSITPTAAGTYTYTLTGENALNSAASNTFSMTVEADPTFTSFLVNGATAISVNTNTGLSFTGSGYSTGATLQARSGATNVSFPGAASASAGTSTYYGAAKKTLNGITRYSANRAVTVTTVAPGPVCEDNWGYSYWNETEYEGSGYELSVYWRGVAKYSGYRSQSGGSLVGNDGKTYSRYGSYGVCKVN